MLEVQQQKPTGRLTEKTSQPHKIPKANVPFITPTARCCGKPVSERGSYESEKTTGCPHFARPQPSKIDAPISFSLKRPSHKSLSSLRQGKNVITNAIAYGSGGILLSERFQIVFLVLSPFGK
jgi:hypothetical protein